MDTGRFGYILTMAAEYQLVESNQRSHLWLQKCTSCGLLRVISLVKVRNGMLD